MNVKPWSSEVNPCPTEVTRACEDLVMLVISLTVLSHSLGEGGVTEGGTALEAIFLLLNADFWAFFRNV
jgi:hypothetical protein